MGDREEGRTRRRRTERRRGPREGAHGDHTPSSPPVSSASTAFGLFPPSSARFLLPQLSQLPHLRAMPTLLCSATRRSASSFSWPLPLRSLGQEIRRTVTAASSVCSRPVVSAFLGLALLLAPTLAQAQVTFTGIRNGSFGTVFPGVTSTLSTTAATAPILRVTGPANSTQTLLVLVPTTLAASPHSIPLSGWQGRTLTNNQGTITNLAIPGSGLIDVQIGADGILDLWIGATATPLASQVSGSYNAVLQISLASTPSITQMFTLGASVTQGLSLESVRHLSFGVLPKGTSKTVAVTSSASGRIHITGQPGTTIHYTLTLPTHLTRQGGSETLAVTDWQGRSILGATTDLFAATTAQRRTVTLPNSAPGMGLLQLDLGGTVTVGALQRAGQYTATVTIVTSYAGF